MEKFSNNFLISMPHLNDTVFGKSLIYLCNHNNLGAMGIIINKPMATENTTNLLVEIGLKKQKSNIEIYFGGPVQISMGMILHDYKYKTKGTMKISKSISLSSNIDIINDICNDNGPNQFKLALGYAGWDKGQLEKEIENGDWLLVPSNYDLIFNTPSSKILDKLKSLIDIDINHFSGGLSGLS